MPYPTKLFPISLQFRVTARQRDKLYQYAAAHDPPVPAADLLRDWIEKLPRAPKTTKAKSDRSTRS